MANRDYRKKRRSRFNWGFIVVVSALAAAAAIITLSRPLELENVPTWDELLSEPQDAQEAQPGKDSADSEGTEDSAPGENATGVFVHILDVGQGDAILIQTQEQNVLIDAGTSDSAVDVVAYLRAQNVRKLDLIVATHPHADHIGGMAEVIRRFSVAKIIMPEVPEALGAAGYSYERMLEAVAAKGLRIARPRPGEEIELGGARLTFLGPVEEDPANMNNNSIVARLTCGENSFLLTGDCEEDEEESLLDAGVELSADVLKLGHHGSNTSTSADFLDAVHPRWAVASCGWDNSYGHPHRAVLRLLENAGVALWRTDMDGTVVFHSDGENITVTAENTEEKAA